MNLKIENSFRPHLPPELPWIAFASKRKKREEMALTVCWLSCDIRPVVQNPENHVEIVLYHWPQLTLLNLFSKIHHEQGNTTSKAEHNTVKRVK